MSSQLRIFAFCLALCFTCPLNSQVRFKAGEIVLEDKGNDFYNAEVYLIIDWPAVITKTTVNIDWGDGSSLESIPLSGGGPVTSPNANYAKLRFIGSHSFAPGAYTVTVVDSFLIADFANIPNSGAQKITLRNFFTTDQPPFYNEPVVVVGPGSGVVASKSFCDYSQVLFGITQSDSNGDSLSFTVVGHPEYPGYVMPPVSTAWGLTFTTAVAPGKYNISLRMDEWRKLGGGNPPLHYGSIWREFFVEIADCTGMEEPDDKSRAGVFPNPNSGLFSLKWSGPLNERIFYELLDSTGKLLLSGSASSETEQLEFNLGSSVPPGLYLLRVKTGGQGHGHKLLIE